jgi:hypothetical protein
MFKFVNKLIATLHFLRDLRMDPICKYYITLGFKAFPGINTPAY